MADEPQRTVVDGIDYASVFRFPRILRSITSAMHPPRIIIALLMVTALITGGRIWDRLTEPTLPPSGLTAPPLTDLQRDQLQFVLRSALARFALETGGGAPDLSDRTQLRPRDVLRRMQQGWRDRRLELVDDPASADALARLDQTYRTAIDEIRQLRPLGTFEASALHAADSLKTMIGGTLALDGAMVIGGARALVIVLPTELWRHDPWFVVVYGLLALIVFAFGGAALSRLAACHWASGERLTISQAVDFGLGAFSNSALALLLPLVLAGLVAVIVVLLGLLMRLPWLLDLLGALVYGFALLLGGVVAFLLLAYVAAFSLLIPAVAVERCDPSDAQQRAYAYLLNRPLHLLGYAVVALVGFVLGYIVVTLVLSTTLNLTATLFGTFTDHSALAVTGEFSLFDLSPPAGAALHPTTGDQWAAAIISFWQTAVLCLVPSWVLSYYFTASTIVYLLLRRAWEGQAEQEIWRGGDAKWTA